MVDTFLFSYGSNGIAQLTKRLQRPVLQSFPAYINNHARIFAGYNSKWKGGVASIVKIPGHRVYGILVPVTDDDLCLLDRFERGYKREMKTTHDQANKRIVPAVAYVMKDPAFTHLPSPEYLQSIQRTMKDRGLTGVKRLTVIQAYDVPSGALYKVK
jgi:hypothetical protein